MVDDLTLLFSRCLLASIKALGRCLCPRCLIPKEKVPEMGTKRDMAQRDNKGREDSTTRHYDISMVRKWIFTKGFPVGGAQVEKVLRPLSLTPHKVTVIVI